MLNSHSKLAVAVLVTAFGCGDKDPPALVLGPVSRFKVAHPERDEGLQIEVRMPKGFLPHSMMSSWSYNRKKRDPEFTIATYGPARLATFDQPCGTRQLGPNETVVMTSRIERPDDLTVSCEHLALREHWDHREVTMFRVIRLMRAHGAEVECSAQFWARENDPSLGNPSADRRAVAFAVCASMRVTGLTDFSNKDWMNDAVGNPYFYCGNSTCE